MLASPEAKAQCRGIGADWYDSWRKWQLLSLTHSLTLNAGSVRVVPILQFSLKAMFWVLSSVNLSHGSSLFPVHSCILCNLKGCHKCSLNVTGLYGREYSLFKCVCHGRDSTMSSFRAKLEWRNHRIEHMDANVLPNNSLEMVFHDESSHCRNLRWGEC